MKGSSLFTVFLQFHGELAGLAPASGHEWLPRRLPAPASAKDCIEALGCPHTEIDLLLADGRPVAFSFLVDRELKLEVFPVPSENASPVWPNSRLQPRPLRHERFVCDAHLGKLARLLRMLGFDTAYSRLAREPDLARSAGTEDRAVLTRSRALLKHRRIRLGRLIHSRHVDIQTTEVIRRFRLAPRIEPFGRCAVCNGELESVAKELVAERIPAQTLAWRDTYFRCLSCDHLYWDGTHVARLRRRFATILATAREDG